MAFPSEIIDLLVAQGVGTYGEDIFLSSKGVIPTGDGPYLTILETGGLSAERTQNTVAVPAYRRPALQFNARAKKYSEAKAMIEQVYSIITAIRNVELSGVWYREARPLQEPFDLMNDTNGRVQLVFNAIFIKRSS